MRERTLKAYLRPLCEPFVVSGRDSILQAASPLVKYGTNVKDFTPDVGVMSGTTVIGYQDDGSGFGGTSTTVSGFQIDDDLTW